MVNSDLGTKLSDLHAELARTDRVDPHARQLLVALLDDITRLLDTSEESRRVHAPDEPALPDRLEGLAVQFDAEHPALSTALRRVVDALAKAGI